MEDVKREAARRKIELLVLPTTKAIAALKKNPRKPTRSCTSPVEPTKRSHHKDAADKKTSE